MNADLKELDHLAVTLLSLTMPISASNWDDTLDTWLAVERLCGEVKAQVGNGSPSLPSWNVVRAV